MSVVQFPEAKRMVWVCPCGCSSFTLLGDGGAECIACDRPVSEAGAWYETKPEAPKTTEAPFEDIRGDDDTDFARRRARQIAADPDVRLLVSKSEANVRVWCAIATEEDRQWMLRGLDDAREVIVARRLP